MYLLSLFNLRFSPFSSGHSLVKGSGFMCLVESAMVLTWYSLSSWFKKQTKKFILPTSLSPIGSVVGAGGLVGFRFKLVCWLVCFGRWSGIGGGVGSLLRHPRHCFVLFCFTACLFLLLEVRWISLGSVRVAHLLRRADGTKSELGKGETVGKDHYNRRCSTTVMSGLL